MKGAGLIIEPARVEHVERWALMRAALWPDAPIDDHRQEILALLRDASDEMLALIAFDDRREAVGFAEATIRHDYVNGCDTSPVAFLEGIYVEPCARRAGVAQALAEAVARWGAARGCAELASDADLANHASHAFHHAIGFTETERVVYFRKLIG
jgi:aminoglycoside 6'-N-acetyltransferase I